MITVVCGKQEITNKFTSFSTRFLHKQINNIPAPSKQLIDTFKFLSFYQIKIFLNRRTKKSQLISLACQRPQKIPREISKIQLDITRTTLTSLLTTRINFSSRRGNETENTNTPSKRDSGKVLYRSGLIQACVFIISYDSFYPLVCLLSRAPKGNKLNKKKQQQIMR